MPSRRCSSTTLSRTKRTLLHCLRHQDTRYMTSSTPFLNTTLSEDKASIVYRSCTAYAIKTLFKHDAEQDKASIFTVTPSGCEIYKIFQCSSTTLSGTKRVSSIALAPLMPSRHEMRSTFKTGTTQSEESLLLLRRL